MQIACAQGEQVNKGILRLVVLGALVSPCLGQQSTTTNCTMYGNTANCTSNTTDYGAQQQRAYQEGQQAGDAIGKGLARAMQAHKFARRVKKYCEDHPGNDWHSNSTSGHCPSEAEKLEIAENEFMAHHKELMHNSANHQAIDGYIEAHNLDPHEKKSYERAYNDLKKTGQLERYAR